MYVFGRFELDEQLYELRSNGEPVKITPRVYDLLSYLIRNRGRVVPKEELIEQVWQRKFVSESSLPTCINLARKALGEPPDAPVLIQTVYGRGYRFTAEVEERSDAQLPDKNGHSASETVASLARPFVGRSRELEQLRQAFDQAATGRGRLVTLSGGPGMGKTRTTEEFAEEARARGARVLVGRCYEGEGPPVFWPWVQIVRSYLQNHEPAQLLYALGASGAEVASLVPELRDLVPNLTEPAPEHLSSDAGRFQLFDALSRFLVRLAGDEPLVLLLDDLHAADAPSLMLLAFLARELARARILVIATYRDTPREREHPLSATLSELTREELTRSIELKELRESDIEAFLEATSGHEPPSELVSLVYRKTEGNPLFMAEVVRLLDAEQKLDHAEEVRSWSVTIPQGVRETIRRRLAQLSDATNGLLTLSAVCGRDFCLTTLEAAGDLSGIELLERLQEAVAARILNEAAGPLSDYRFSHGLIHEMIYDELALSDRAQLHLRVAQAIEALHEANLTPHLAELAHHFGQATPLIGAEKTIEYETRAGQRAATLMAFEDAAGHFSRALRALESSEDPDISKRGELLLSLSGSSLQAGNWEAARETLGRAADHARDVDSAEFLARVALRHPAPSPPGVITDHRPDAISSKLLEEALIALGDSDSTLRALVLSRLSLELYWTSSHEHCLRLSQEALEMARRLGDAPVQASVLLERHQLLLEPDHLQDRLPLATEALKHAEAAGARDLCISGHQALLHDLLELGDPVGVDVEIEAITQLEEAVKPPRPLATRTMRQLYTGRFDSAAQALREIRDHESGFGRAEPTFRVEMQMFNLLWMQGRMAELEAAVRRFVARNPEVPAWRAAMAGIFFQSGRELDARTELDRLLESNLEALPRNAAWFWSVAEIAELTISLEATEAAEPLYALLSPFSERVVVIPPAAMFRQVVSYYLGGLAVLLGRFEDSELHYHHAIDLNTRLHARPFATYSRLHFGRMLLRRGAPGDREQARARIHEALAEARELGMQPLIAGALAVLMEAGLD